MSNYRAIAAMSATLQQMVYEAVKEVAPGTHVVTAPPQKETDRKLSKVSIFLYQVSPNASWRNAELPVRRADGGLIHRPQIALDLHYLFTFFGDEENLIPQLLLGRTAIALHSQPYPPPHYMPHKPLDLSSDPRSPSRLWDSGLRDQIAHLQIIPEALSHHELSDLWPLFFQVPFALSTGYRVSVVLITEELTPEAPLPVHSTTLYTPSRDLPELDGVIPQQADYADSLRLTLKGRNLATPGTSVSIGGRSAEIETGSGGTAVVKVPDGLAPGMHEVQVARDIPMGADKRPHRVFESNTSFFVLRPVIAGITFEAGVETMRVQLKPSLSSNQRPTLLLNEIGGQGERPLSLSLPGEADASGSHLSFRCKSLKSGTYLARVRVDGVTSPLYRDLDPASPNYDRFVGPQVTVP